MTNKKEFEALLYSRSACSNLGKSRQWVNSYRRRYESKSLKQVTINNLLTNLKSIEGKVC